MNNFLIRKADYLDTGEIAKLEEKTFPLPWGVNIIYSELIRDDAFYVVIYDENILAAFGGYQNILGQGHITTMAVLERYRGAGLSKEILKSLILHANDNEVRELTLEVRVSNKVAIKLYESFGFKIYGTRKNYYLDNNEDAYIMWRFEDGK